MTSTHSPPSTSTSTANLANDESPTHEQNKVEKEEKDDQQKVVLSSNEVIELTKFNQRKVSRVYKDGDRLSN